MSYPLINPYQQFFDSSGSPLVSGTIEFRDPTTNAYVNSYPTASDADAQTNANDNPLTLDSYGAAATGIYLEDGVKYKVVLKDAQGATVTTQGGNSDYVLSPLYSAASIGEKLYAQTAEESSAGVTPSNYQYEPGDVRRYGAVGDDSTDDTTALSNAAASSKRVYIDPSLQCRVTAEISNLQSGQKWYGGGEITTANSFNHHVFNLSGVTDFTVENITGTAGTLSAAYNVATARFIRAVSSSHRCRVLNCKITGFQSAIQFNASEHCQAIGNDIITPDGWGINVQTDAHDAIVQNNRINGVVSEHGIYVAGTNSDNIRSPHVSNNIVTGCGDSGIKLAYCNDAHVHNNDSYSNGEEGIYVDSGSVRPSVHHNNCYSNTKNGVLVFTSVSEVTKPGTDMSGILIENNHVYSNTVDGIRIQVSNADTTIDNTKIRYNDIDNNGTNGINLSVVSGTNSNTLVDGNGISNETTAINVGASVTSTVIGQNRYTSNTTDWSDGGTSTTIEHETSGATASVADGGTVTHGHPTTPASVVCTGTVSGQMIAVTARGSSTFTVAIKNHDNTAGSTQTVYWRCVG